MSEWTNSDIEYLRNNFESCTKKELAAALGKTENAIQIKANRIGLKKKDKYHYRKDYFHDIATPTQAYWLGFIYADGYVTQDKSRECTYSVGIELSVRDESHLKKFNKDIEGNVDLTYRHRENKFDVKTVSGDTCCIRLYCSSMAMDLIEHGCCKNKSLTKGEPIGVPDEYMWDFIRGYFDGNGTICWSYNRKVDKSYIKVTIESGSINFMNWLSGYLESNDIKNHVMPDGGKSYKIQIASKSRVEFLNNMYKDATQYLDRKYDKYIVAVYGEGT